LLFTVNNRLILEIEIVHDLSCHPIFRPIMKSYTKYREREMCNKNKGMNTTTTTTTTTNNNNNNNNNKKAELSQR